MSPTGKDIHTENVVLLGRVFTRQGFKVNVYYKIKDSDLL